MNKTSPEISKGTIVKYKDGFVRVTARFKDTVNLGGVFNGRIYHRGIPLSEVKEAEKEFDDYWRTTETYKCM